MNFLQNPKYFLKFLSISEIYIKFWTFWKKKMRIIADLFQKFIDCQKSGYLNA